MISLRYFNPSLFLKKMLILCQAYWIVLAYLLAYMSNSPSPWFSMIGLNNPSILYHLGEIQRCRGAQMGKLSILESFTVMHSRFHRQLSQLGSSSPLSRWDVD